VVLDDVGGWNWNTLEYDNTIEDDDQDEVSDINDGDTHMTDVHKPHEEEGKGNKVESKQNAKEKENKLPEEQDDEYPLVDFRPIDDQDEKGFDVDDMEKAKRRWLRDEGVCRCRGFQKVWTAEVKTGPQPSKQMSEQERLREARLGYLHRK
jgi:hypothetical protein